MQLLYLYYLLFCLAYLIPFKIFIFPTKATGSHGTSPNFKKSIT